MVQIVCGAAALLSVATALAAMSSAVAAGSTAAAATAAAAGATGPLGAASATVSWLQSRLASCLLSVAQLVVGQLPGSGGAWVVVAGAGEVQGLLLRGAAWGVALAAASAVRRSLDRLQERFFKGQYPPPRNTDRS